MIYILSAELYSNVHCLVGHDDIIQPLNQEYNCQEGYNSFSPLLEPNPRDSILNKTPLKSQTLSMALAC